MSTATKGRHNEHRIRDVFIEAGAVVIRAAGSKGVCDLFAICDRRYYPINVKTNQWAPPKEREAMVVVFAHHPNFVLVLARYDDGDTEPKFQYYDKGDKKWKAIARIQLLTMTFIESPQELICSPKKSESRPMRKSVKKSSSCS